jgi:competence protein ComEA
MRWAFLVLLVLAMPVMLATGCEATAEEIRITQSLSPPIGEVYVEGEVDYPGFYPVQQGDSLEDLLLDAGVVLEEYPLQIKVSVGVDSGNLPQRVDLNRAEAWLLDALPGIGPTKAQAIIDYRTEHGPFKNTAELVKVTGISETIYQQVKELVTLSDPVP